MQMLSSSTDLDRDELCKPSLDSVDNSPVAAVAQLNRRACHAVKSHLFVEDQHILVGWPKRAS